MIEEYRKEIDTLDEEILRLFEKRLEVCKKIGEYKRKNGLGVCCQERESEVLRRADEGFFGSKKQELMKKIIEMCKEVQEE